MPFDNLNRAPFGDLDLLMDARSRISSRDSWVQGQFRDGERECLVAALSVVSGSRSFSTPNPTERRLARILAAHLTSRQFWTRIMLIPARRRLIMFNDDPRTRHNDILALFDRAIDCVTSEQTVYISA
jgi:hypothetical protein